MHKPIIINEIALSFPNKTCFENFSAVIYPGSRIGIIGRNGGGKSCLLKVLCGDLDLSEGNIQNQDNVSMAYVEQTITDYDHCSGGERFNKRLTQALSCFPDILLLDEPSNHLDSRNRSSLIKMLNRFDGTLIVVSHDITLLRSCVDTLWHVDHGVVHQFSGGYDDYLLEQNQRMRHFKDELAVLNREKKKTHQRLMKEQKRAANSKSKGQKNVDNRKWPTVVSHAKALRAEKTSGKKRADIGRQRQELNDKLSSLYVPEMILPHFSIEYQKQQGAVLSVRDGAVGYDENCDLLHDINFHVYANEKVAIAGVNGSGKSTLLKAIVQDKRVKTSGDWVLPDVNTIGYLDQHYQNLDDALTPFEQIKAIKPGWSDDEIRKHLIAFLFRKNEEVFKSIQLLSGGEKARLSLCLISARVPRLLVLDEITNNLDMETKDHVAQILKAYPGCVILVSHDDVFLQEVGVDRVFKVGDR